MCLLTQVVLVKDAIKEMFLLLLFAASRTWSAKMWIVTTDAAWSDLCLVCRLGTTMSCVKMVETVQMPFGVWTRVGPTNHVLGGGLYLPGAGTILGASPCRLLVQGISSVSQSYSVGGNSDLACRCQYCSDSCSLVGGLA